MQNAKKENEVQRPDKGKFQEGVQEREKLSTEKMEPKVNPFAPGERPLELEGIPEDLNKVLEVLKVMSMDMQHIVRVTNATIDYLVSLQKTIQNEVQEQLERSKF